MKYLKNIIINIGVYALIAFWVVCVIAGMYKKINFLYKRKEYDKIT